MSAKASRILIIGLLLIFAQRSPLQAQPAGINQVLELDGKGSYVELPARLFTNEVVTVEGWVKWREFALYSRFVDFADASRYFNVINYGVSSELQLQIFKVPDFQGLKGLRVPGALPLDQWVHLAGVVGPNFSKLYLNGFLLTTNEVIGGWFPGERPPPRNFLGRSVMKGVSGSANDADFKGQMAEVRLWGYERAEREIRGAMFQRLTGGESGLLALWNFADGSARDATPARRDGKLLGGARIVEAILPTVAPLPWARLRVTFTDASGMSLQDVVLRAEVNGAEVGSSTSQVVLGQTTMLV